MGEAAGVKITALRTLVVNAEMRNWVFVRVDTDEPGLYGWGEATLEWKTRAVVGAVQDLEPLVVGRDPRDIEQLARIMNKHGFWRIGVIGPVEGHWEVPERPGLGIEIAEDVAARHPYRPEVQHAAAAVLPDGTIVDW